MKLSSLRSPILQHPTLIFARILINWQLTTERLGLPDDQTQLSVAHIDHRVVAGSKHDFKRSFHMFEIYVSRNKKVISVLTKISYLNMIVLLLLRGRDSLEKTRPTINAWCVQMIKCSKPSFFLEAIFVYNPK